MKRRTHPFKNQKRKGGAPEEQRQIQNRFGEFRMSHLPK